MNQPLKESIVADGAGSEVSRATVNAASAPPSNAPADTPPASAGDGGTKKKQKQEIDTLERFITFAYAKKGRKVALSGKVEKRIAMDPRLDAAAMQRLLALSKKDMRLAVPRQLLLVARDIVGYPALRGTLHNFVREAFLAHPLFRRPQLLAAIQNLPDGMSPAEALVLVANSEASLLTSPDKAPPMKRAQFSELCANAAYSLALWFAANRGLSAGALNEALYRGLWSRSAASLRDETAKLRALTEVRDLAGVGTACSQFKIQADERLRAADAAQAAAEAAREETKKLQEEIEALAANVSRLEEEIRALREASEREKSEQQKALTHLRDELEQQRTRVLRRLKADVTLLDDGLLALRRDPPKAHVMDDHAERVSDSLRQEIAKLESGG